MKSCTSHCRWAVLAAITLASFFAVALHGPITQDPSYHQFADQRTLFGIPHLWNVLSNLPFLLAGLAGLYQLASGKARCVLPELRAPYWIFFAASAVIAFGSGYYHWAPSDGSLIWDRLPITLAFMAFFSIIVGEHLNPTWGRRALWPLLCAGLISVAWWALQGDLRAYVLVQFLPLLLVPFIVLLFPSRLTRIGFVWGVLGTYALAKGFEYFDASLYEAVGMSGHTIKHLLASVTMFIWVIALSKRQPKAEIREG